MKNLLIDKCIISVKVGPKGQITIPKEVRNMFDIQEGETLMVVADKNKGIVIIKSDEIYKIMGDNKHE